MQCDLRRPFCLQCEQRGLVCGGYDDHRVFVAQTDYTFATSPRSRSESSDENVAIKLHAKENLGISRLTKRQFDYRGSDSFGIILPEHLLRSAYGEKSMEICWDNFLPHDSASGAGLKIIITSPLPNVLPTLYVKDEALRMAVLAFSSAVAGQAKGDDWLINQGKKMYGKALQELSKALLDPSRAQGEAMVAVPRVMGLFEVRIMYQV
jgi:hypothetical protein